MSLSKEEQETVDRLIDEVANAVGDMEQERAIIVIDEVIDRLDTLYDLIATAIANGDMEEDDG